VGPRVQIGRNKLQVGCWPAGRVGSDEANSCKKPAASGGKDEVTFGIGMGEACLAFEVAGS